HCGGVAGLWESTAATWRGAGLAPVLFAAFDRMRERLASPDPRCDIEAQLDALERCAARILCLSDPGYPPLLKTLYDPPPFLYLRGRRELLLQPQLAMVGARQASHGGLSAARELAAAVARAGLVVTSGLALGIDGAAHRGALGAGGGSVAVMATGIEQIYPRRHRALGEELAREGCLVTEFPPLSQPLPGHFPRRNRLVSGLALGVLVVEAALPSGSLITAGTALEQGREVFTLPWSIHHPGGAGCLHLLRDGATLVSSAQVLLEELAQLTGSPLAACATVDTGSGCAVVGGRDPADESLLMLIGDGAINADDLVMRSGLPLARVLERLSALELDGRVHRGSGGYCRT
ncbi:MAG: DNA-processing protein DprA, partial [Parahaliea sp.]